MPNSTYGPYVFVANSGGGQSRVCPEMVAAIHTAYRLAGLSTKLVYTQGGLNASSVAASAATHNGLCVADLKTNGVLTSAQRWTVTTCLLRCGVVAFIRGVQDSLTEHIHCVMANPRHAHSSAKAQVAEYRRGGDGLVGSRSFYGPNVPFTTWEDSPYHPDNAKDWLDMVSEADLKKIVRAEVLAALAQDNTMPNYGFLDGGGEKVSYASAIAGLGRKIDARPTADEIANTVLSQDGWIRNPNTESTNEFIALATALTVGLRAQAAMGAHIDQLITEAEAEAARDAEMTETVKGLLPPKTESA